VGKESLDLPPVLAEPPRHPGRRRVIAAAEMFRRHQLDRILVVPIVLALMIVLVLTLFPPNNDGGSDPCAGQTSSSCSP
jgi:hypothetical protein